MRCSAVGEKTRTVCTALCVRDSIAMSWRLVHYSRACRRGPYQEDETRANQWIAVLCVCDFQCLCTWCTRACICMGQTVRTRVK